MKFFEVVLLETRNSHLDFGGDLGKYFQIFQDECHASCVLDYAAREQKQVHVWVLLKEQTPGA